MIIILLALLAAAYVLVWLDEAWWLMLAAGDMHRDWWHQVPLMGFKAALPIGFTLASFISVPVGALLLVQARGRKSG